MEQLEIIRPQIKSRDSLHLKMSMRSFRSEKVSIFVNQLLALQKEEATSTLRELVNYPIVITRSLYTAKQWLRAQLLPFLGEHELIKHDMHLFDILG